MFLFLFTLFGLRLINIFFTKKSNFNLLFSFLVSKLKNSLRNGNKVLIRESLAVTTNELLLVVSHDLYGDVTIRTVLSQDFNLDLLLSALNLDLTLLEDELTWVVIIKNSDSASSVLTIKSFRVFLVAEVNIEVFIRFPVFTVNDLDLDDSLLLVGSHGNKLVFGGVVLGGLSSTILSLHPESEFLILSFFNCQVNKDRAFGNGVV